jgi:hypothetical protein
MGVVFLVGATFNVAWTLTHADEFFGGFADGAWSRPAESLMRDFIIPNGRRITILIIVFQVTIGVLILTRGQLVTPALVAGGLFAVAAALVSSPGGTAGNLVLAAIQFGLAFAR